ncbi:MAG: ParA family protein [Planktothrix sp.]
MDHKPCIIVCNYIKGGVGKTTLAVHVAGMLAETTIKQVLLIDCDIRPDAWQFFTGRRAKEKEPLLVSVEDNLDVLWNPPQITGPRFKPIAKQDYYTYDYVVIDTDSPPDDSLTILANDSPDIFLVPIAKSQSHALENLSWFLELLEDEVQFGISSRTNYQPIVRIIPLGSNIKEIKSQIDLNYCSHIKVEIFQRMKCLSGQTVKSLKEKKLLWHYPKLQDTKYYFKSMIES